jgi:hypothetical protein
MSPPLLPPPTPHVQVAAADPRMQELAAADNARVQAEAALAALQASRLPCLPAESIPLSPSC